MNATVTPSFVHSELAALRAYVLQIARLTTGGGEGTDGGPFVMEGEDAISALNMLISQARELTSDGDGVRYEVITFDDRPGRAWEILNEFPGLAQARQYAAVCRGGGPYIRDAQTNVYYAPDGAVLSAEEFAAVQAAHDARCP